MKILQNTVSDIDTIDFIGLRSIDAMLRLETTIKNRLWHEIQKFSQLPDINNVELNYDKVMLLHWVPWILREHSIASNSSSLQILWVTIPPEGLSKGSYWALQFPTRGVNGPYMFELIEAPYLSEELPGNLDVYNIHRVSNIWTKPSRLWYGRYTCIGKVMSGYDVWCYYDKKTRSPLCASIEPPINQSYELPEDNELFWEEEGYDTLDELLSRVNAERRLARAALGDRIISEACKRMAIPIKLTITLSSDKPLVKAETSSSIKLIIEEKERGITFTWDGSWKENNNILWKCVDSTIAPYLVSPTGNKLLVELINDKLLSSCSKEDTEKTITVDCLAYCDGTICVYDYDEFLPELPKTPMREFLENKLYEQFTVKFARKENQLQVSLYARNPELCKTDIKVGSDTYEYDSETRTCTLTEHEGIIAVPMLYNEASKALPCLLVTMLVKERGSIALVGDFGISTKEYRSYTNYKTTIKLPL